MLHSLACFCYVVNPPISSGLGLSPENVGKSTMVSSMHQSAQSPNKSRMLSPVHTSTQSTSKSTKIPPARWSTRFLIFQFSGADNHSVSFPRKIWEGYGNGSGWVGMEWSFYKLPTHTLYDSHLLHLAYCNLAAGVAIISWKSDCVADAVTLYQYTLVLISPTSEGWQAESTPWCINSAANGAWTQDLRIPSHQPA